MILFLDENAQPKEATFLHQTICSTSNSEGPFVDLKFICFLDWFDGATKPLHGQEFDDAWEFLREFVQIETRTGEFAE